MNNRTKSYRYFLSSSPLISCQSLCFSEFSRTAPKADICNSNIFYKLINLGDVIVETAGSEETLTFNKVFDPASVREEIFNRWAIYQQKQKEAVRDSTNQQVMDALREYHRLTSQPSP